MKVNNLSLIIPKIDKLEPTSKSSRDGENQAKTYFEKATEILISAEARKRLQDEKVHQFIQAEREKLADFLSQLKEGENDPEEGYEIKRKCFIIALRIINGDRVPAKDVAYLAEHDGQMYSQAMMLKMNNDNPKKFKSILEDEKERMDLLIVEQDSPNLDKFTDVQDNGAASNPTSSSEV